MVTVDHANIEGRHAGHLGRVVECVKLQSSFFLHICKKAAQKLPPETNQFPTEIFLQLLFVVTGDQVVPVDASYTELLQLIFAFS